MVGEGLAELVALRLVFFVLTRIAFARGYVQAPQRNRQRPTDQRGCKSRVMMDRFTKFATEQLSAAASRIESAERRTNVGKVLRFPYGGELDRKREVV